VGLTTASVEQFEGPFEMPEMTQASALQKIKWMFGLHPVPKTPS
jgi:hypothetical protein